MTNRLLLLMMMSLTGAPALAQLQPEPLGQVATLPVPYPAHWLLVHDLSFQRMREGRFYLVDPSADTAAAQTRAIISGDFDASFAASAERNELYVVETFFARGGRGGERSDVVTIYDAGTLNVKAEVAIPAKRLTGLPNRFQTTLVDGGRFLLVYNFTPAQSVSVVDLVKRQFLSEVPIPGCAFTYPAGQRGFAALCSNGGMLTVALDEAGGVTATHRTEPFNDIDNDAVFEKPVLLNGVAYFPTFTGNVVPVRLAGEQPDVGQAFSLTTAQERAAGWRPGGIWPAIGDRAGRLYVLMHGHGAEGTHKDGGDQVWVFDAAKGKRLSIIKLNGWGISLSMADGDPQMLVVSGLAGALDLYSTVDGSHSKTLAVNPMTPLFVHGVGW